MSEKYGSCKKQSVGVYQVVLETDSYMEEDS
jgi:hypothetical protein